MADAAEDRGPINIEEDYDLLVDPESVDREARRWDTYEEAVATVGANHVWAVVGGDNDDDEEPVWSVLPGWHLVNVLYYVATVQPWTDQTYNNYVY